MLELSHPSADAIRIEFEAASDLAPIFYRLGVVVWVCMALLMLFTDLRALTRAVAITGACMVWPYRFLTQWISIVTTFDFSIREVTIVHRRGIETRRFEIPFDQIARVSASTSEQGLTICLDVPSEGLLDLVTNEPDSPTAHDAFETLLLEVARSGLPLTHDTSEA